MHISRKTKFALFIAVVLWSSAFVGIRAGLTDYSPGGLALLRFLIASACIYLIFLLREKRDTIQKKDKWYALFTGAIGIGIYNAALNYGEISVPAGQASFIVSQSPIITTLFAVIFLHERLSFYGYVGMLISMVGVALIAISETQSAQLYFGLLYILLATIVGSLYSILQKPLLKKYHAIDITTYAMWGGTLSLLLYTPDLIHDLQQVSWESTLVVLYLGIFPAAIAYLAWSYALVEMTASRASVFLYFLPVIATLLGWAWLGEVPGIMALVGGLIALAGVWIVNRAEHNKMHFPRNESGFIT